MELMRRGTNKMRPPATSWFHRQWRDVATPKKKMILTGWDGETISRSVGRMIYMVGCKDHRSSLSSTEMTKLEVNLLAVESSKTGSIRIRERRYSLTEKARRETNLLAVWSTEIGCRNQRSCLCSTEATKREENLLAVWDEVITG